MRKVLFALLFLSFGVLILGFSVKRAVAVEVKVPTPTVGAVAAGQVAAAVAKEDNYALPFPGSILPDSPLYSLKMVRDRIWLALTTDSLKRAELLLHYADKRLATAQVLAEKKQFDLAITTLTKAEKYLEEVVAQEKVASNKKRETKDLLGLILKSSKKHEDVLLGFQAVFPENQRNQIGDLLKYSRQAYLEAAAVLAK